MQLGPVSGSQVKNPFSFFPPACKSNRSFPAVIKTVENGLINLVAAGPDGGADNGQDVLRCGGKGFHENTGGPRGNSENGSLPSGMHGPDHPSFAVGEEYRDTVSRFYPDGNSGYRGNDAVVFEKAALPPVLKRLINHQEPVSVDLIHRNEGVLRHVEGSAQQFPVARQVLVPVPHVHTEIEIGQPPLADPSPSGAKGVGYETALTERLGFQIPHAAHPGKSECAFGSISVGRVFRHHSLAFPRPCIPAPYHPEAQMKNA